MVANQSPRYDVVLAASFHFPRERLPSPMRYRRATIADVPLLARMNARLIQDEGHRNAMAEPELQMRMHGWLAAEYTAVIFESDAAQVGYVLYRREEPHIYLRQFFVDRYWRRQGVGRAAIEWLLKNEWLQSPRVRLEVLTGNATAIAFWRAVGFADYAITMERPTSPLPEK
jgi:ribosomal protein S18 acetylase RimI-like enzyme